MVQQILTALQFVFGNLDLTRALVDGAFESTIVPAQKNARGDDKQGCRQQTPTQSRVQPRPVEVVPVIETVQRGRCGGHVHLPVNIGDAPETLLAEIADFHQVRFDQPNGPLGLEQQFFPGLVGGEVVQHPVHGRLGVIDGVIPAPDRRAAECLDLFRVVYQVFLRGEQHIAVKIDTVVGRGDDIDRDIPLLEKVGLVGGVHGDGIGVAEQ